MEKSTRILLYAILGVVLFHGLYNLFFSHSRLKDAVNEIKGVKADLKMVSDSLAASRKKLGEIVQNLNENQDKINLMRKGVEILYLDYQRDGAASNAERTALKKQLNEEEKYLDSLRKELAKIEN